MSAPATLNNQRGRFVCGKDCGNGALDDRDLIIVITGVLEAFGMSFVALDAFEPQELAPELPL